MKSSELRIGNFVSGIYPIEVVSQLEIDGCVTTLYFEFIRVVDYTSERCQKESEVNPIPITTEWLEKFGFEKHQNGFQTTSLCSYHIDCSDGWDSVIFADPQPEGFINVGIGSVSIDEHYVLHTKIEHVHQLQNLYFALTGEELNLTK